MYNTNGSVVNICPQLEVNSEESYYRLEVVAADLQSERLICDTLDQPEHIYSSL